ncbi:methylamine utilization protein MauE [Catellatospora sp. TT07R-123]|uniref:MauE/DoxX family redox-associated membrane protein n=1 Tax=Catellatospora sp. TT07R-123 TaxID=2733863 RepID=UPI001B13E1E9|nr:MauE/DoxX family redox-associated membrane protein [Catellatospora sp. TT07R-123]GHJ47626.1 methylamine utilization protein MauE [Catellatospora sp. TT07R-123]
MNLVLITLHAALAVVFATAAYSKLRRPSALRAFTASLRELGLVPRALAAPLGLLVAAAEVAATGLLLWPPTAGAGLVLSGLLLVAFSAVIGLVLRRGTTAYCRCFGASGGLLRADHAVRNLTLALAAALGLAAGPVDLTASGSVAELAAAAFAVAVGVSLALPVVRWDDLRFLFTTTKEV